MHHQVDSPSDDLKLAKETAAQSIESLKVVVVEIAVILLDDITRKMSSQMQ